MPFPYPKKFRYLHLFFSLFLISNRRLAESALIDRGVPVPRCFDALILKHGAGELLLIGTIVYDFPEKLVWQTRIVKPDHLSKSGFLELKARIRILVIAIKSPVSSPAAFAFEPRKFINPRVKRVFDSLDPFDFFFDFIFLLRVARCARGSEEA